MCNFHIGQKVVCVQSTRVRTFYANTVSGYRPKKGDVVTINYTETRERGDVWLGFEETPDPLCFLSVNFRPLVPDYAESEIESVNISELVEPLYEPA